ncbi:MAG: hypothetical protein HRU21_13190, partial [Pseudomonadales bacterium]|nr:hypothetical protein [Pseudomonadales bacterium]
ILFQQALAFQAATYTLADQLNQILQLALVRCFDAAKSGWSIVAIHIDTIQKQEHVLREKYDFVMVELSCFESVSFDKIDGF